MKYFRRNIATFLVSLLVLLALVKVPTCVLAGQIPSSRRRQQPPGIANLLYSPGPSRRSPSLHGPPSAPPSPPQGRGSLPGLQTPLGLQLPHSTAHDGRPLSPSPPLGRPPTAPSSPQHRRSPSSPPPLRRSPPVPSSPRQNRGTLPRPPSPLGLSSIHHTVHHGRPASKMQKRLRDMRYSNFGVRIKPP
uniref:Uncharacterized protein n=1 Tax=Rhipicephalus appendiculatus TaxID=34631 RepID=A0A131YDB0_RHIAP